MDFDQRLRAFDADLQAAKQKSQLSINEGKFRLESAQVWAKINNDRIKIQMDWNKHVQEVIAKQIQNAKSALELAVLQNAFKDFKYWHKRYTVMLRRKEKEVRKAARVLGQASRVYMGTTIPSIDIVSTWRSFGRIALMMSSMAIFPKTTYGACFVPSKGEETDGMSMIRLAAYCRENKCMVDTQSTQFQSIHEFWTEVIQWSINEMDVMQIESAEIEVKLMALNQQQWAKIF